MNTDKTLYVESETKPSTVRDTFKNRSEIDSMLARLGVDEVDAGAGAHLAWEFANDNYPDDAVINRLFKDKKSSTDEGISQHEQYEVDEYMDRIQEGKLELLETRAVDTGVMKSVHARVLELCQTHHIEDAADLQIEFHHKVAS